VLTKLHQLFTGIVVVATLLTAVVYLWALNSTTVYKRAEADAPSKSP
jgi:hypothetical protein